MSGGGRILRIHGPVQSLTIGPRDLGNFDVVSGSLWNEESRMARGCEPKVILTNQWEKQILRPIFTYVELLHIFNIRSRVE